MSLDMQNYCTAVCWYFVKVYIVVQPDKTYFKDMDFKHMHLYLVPHSSHGGAHFLWGGSRNVIKLRECLRSSPLDSLFQTNQSMLHMLNIYLLHACMEDCAIFPSSNVITIGTDHRYQLHYTSSQLQLLFTVVYAYIRTCGQHFYTPFIYCSNSILCL